jgi:nucleoside-diphosphate-sugar epimerase
MRELEGDVMVLGASGKMGPTLARMAQRAIAAAGTPAKVYAVARSAMPELAEHGVQTVRCDLLDLAAVERLPRARNVVFMAGRKFGSTGAEHLTWAINTIVPYHVGRTFTDSRIVSFSTGCVYPVVHLYSGGSTEAMRPDPVGEYAMSCLGRERVFDYLSSVHHQPVVHIRLNYAVEPRYGVLADIASRIWQGQPVDVTTGFANVIWQGDACDHILRSFTLASSPPAILNVTGPETFAVRQVALRLGELLGKPVTFTGEENGRGYLNNASLALRHFGYPQVPLGKLLEWTAQWVADGGASLGKPTHFETQDGKY